MSELATVRNLKTFQKNVTTAGTPVQLDSYPVDLGTSVTIKAKTANTGSICVGFSSADALNSGTGHIRLAAGQSVTVSVLDTKQIWIDSTVNGEGAEIVVA